MARGKRSPVWLLLKETYGEWSRDDAHRHGAALSYYTVFALPPLLFLVVAISGVVFGQEEARMHLLAQAQAQVGEKGAEAIRIVLENTGGERTSLIATIIGLLFLFVGATAVFEELQKSLNAIWGIRERPGHAVWSLLRARLLSFAVVVSLGVFMLLFLAAGAVVAALEGILGRVWAVPPEVVFVLRALNFLVSFLVVTLVLAMIYKVLPYAHIALRDVWLGAAVTAFLFTAGKFVIGLYLRSSGIVSAYRAAGSLIVLFVWIYFSAQIFFLGAEFTQVYARWRGREIEPSEHAEWIVKRAPAAAEPEPLREDSAA